MDLSGLLDLLRAQEPYQTLVDALTSGGHPGSLGLIGAARPVFSAALAADTRRPLLIVMARMDQANNLAEQILAWEPSLRVLSFPEPNAIFYERAPWGPRSTRARLQVLSELAGERPASLPPLIVTSARGLMQRTLPRDMLLAHRDTLARRARVPGGQPDALLRNWLHMGYELVTVVTETGTFSRRGGIIDVFPVADERPVRVELWGDEIESLRAFDPATQRSLDMVDSVTVTPAREALPVYGMIAAARLKDWFAALPVPSEDDDGFSARSDQEKLLSQAAFPALEFYLPWIVPEPVSLLDYLPGDALVLVDDWQELADTVAELESQALSLRDTHETSGAIPPDMPLPYVTWDTLGDGLAHAGAVEMGGPLLGESAVGDLFAPGPRFAGELKHFLDHLRELQQPQQDRLIVVSRQASRLAELWYERTQGARPQPVETISEPPPPGWPLFVQGALADGWTLHGSDRSIHLLTDAEIFGWKRPEPRRRREPRAVSPDRFFADLSPGDIVVHAEYGIGRFQGLEKRQMADTDREFLVLSYSGGDTLYVPIHQADRITRYVGADDHPPEMSRLGTAEWGRVKERARAAVEEVARDLLDLYAARETVTGHAFNPDTPWQHELEASFPYVETEDQLHALSDVKADMQQPRPMDRLITGDVGYGKTEVALRAAFKAVMDGKQVAMLVPTTVLAQQHYDTFSHRLAPFPVRVEMLSRFRTPAEQDAIVQALHAGSVDIVIGTHRMLSDDVIFKDLGLLIIDEEQRFGVTHKEQLKRMRTEVDVLTMTATPIPRTLYMSLTGVRDVSMINTAPEERLPVRTYVGRRSEELVRQAILRELDRGGQVFFVHNRVTTIYAERDRLAHLVPEATFAVGHGQMNESELEAVMNRFAQGEVDVLVSTSIIEAGLDIPNANTLIVDRADRFGLAQLYQLRGRVGRSANRAFAYFFHPPLAKLTDDARARLETIAEQTELGAGYNIAMRDLEIRGAGDLLGMRQSGQISSVGFHLYTRMLSEAVKRLRAARAGEGPLPAGGEPLLTPREAVTIDLPIPTYIPTDYVPDMGLRIQLYRRMADLPDETAISDLRVELADRFGPPPPVVDNLLYQLRVKQLALRAEVDAIATEGQQISIRLARLVEADRPALQRRLGHDVRVSRSAIWLPRAINDWQDALIDILGQLAARQEGIAA